MDVFIRTFKRCFNKPTGIRHIVILSVCLASVVLSFAETPATAEGRRHWQIAEMYISEGAPDMAMDELRRLIDAEKYAPAYIKLAELYMASGKSDLKDKAEELSEEFNAQWPDKAEEMRTVIEVGKARDNIRRKKFFDSILGNWHFKGIPLNESFYAMKIYRNSQGGISVDVPKECFDGDFITAWQTTRFIQWDDGGLYLDRVNSSWGETYGIKINDAEGGIAWWHFQIYVPFSQPDIEEGKLKIKHRCKYPNGGWSDWREGVFITD